jgi:RimJ/RimL family protein N-acetyltransferase
MQLRALETADIPLVAEWLNREENYRWLDFGGGLQALSAAALRVMNQRDVHRLRLFALDDGGPLGIVALSNINMPSRSATLWYVLGNKAFEGRGHTKQAARKMLKEGFGELGLHSVNAWVVETNQASIRILERIGFRLLGMQRECHLLDGVLRDRLLYDLLATEFRAIGL